MLSDLYKPFPGGAETLAFNLARDLMRRGEDVHVLTGYHLAQTFDGPPFTVEPIGVHDHRDEGAVIVKRYLDEMQPELIITHHLYAYQFEAELVASRVPFVQIVLNRHRLPGAALAVYISEWVRDRAGAQPGDLVITPPVFGDVVAESHGDCIGFIKPIRHKGIDLIYRVASRLPNRKFLILRGEWQTLEDIRPAHNIEFMEPVDDMRDFYARCRLMLMPSLSEDAGTVAQEATLNGLPCISSNVDGLAETNRGGILLPSNDVRGFVSWIQRLDDAATYDSIVERQQAHLASTNQTERLDEFAARVAALK